MKQHFAYAFLTKHIINELNCELLITGTYAAYNKRFNDH